MEGMEDMSSLRANNAHGVYDNQALMSALNISSAYLRKLRDNGYLGFSRHGDKYWLHAGGCRPLPETLPL